MPERRRDGVTGETPWGDGRPNLTMAVPAPWTKDAKCIDMFVLYDADRMEDKAAEMCAGCPVIEQCLSAAMEEEGTQGARNRYGVRGGLGPEGRAKLALASRTCGRGHVGQTVAYANRDTLRCLECEREDARARYAGNEGIRRRAMVSCVECRAEVQVAGLARHIGRYHREETAA